MPNTFSRGYFFYNKKGEEASDKGLLEHSKPHAEKEEQVGNDNNQQQKKKRKTTREKRGIYFSFFYTDALTTAKSSSHTLDTVGHRMGGVVALEITKLWEAKLVFNLSLAFEKNS